jgi:methyl-accepting chemotaxis protein
MRGTVLNAENARRSISNMRRLQLFDDRRLKADMLQQSDYKQTDIFRTVPIVAAFDAIAQVSSKEGYEFRVAAHQPRDAANTPREDEEPILRQLENDKTAEYFIVEDKTNEMVYARPIELTAD